MAITPKLITRNTVVAAIACVAVLLTSIWAFIEFAPERDDEWTRLEQQAPVVYDKSAPHRDLDVPFRPDEVPEDPRVCAFVSANVLDRFEELAAGDRVVFHTRGIAGLVGGYIDLGCPAAIHEGDWHTTAQILRVALVYEALRPQAEIYDAEVEWDPRAEHLLVVATSTYDVLAPSRMCKEALGVDAVDADSVASPAEGLYATCMKAFRR